MRALDRKLLRDLWAIKGQALAIALVIASGVSIFVVYRSNAASLERSKQVYYDRYRMADVFASVQRAPLSLIPRIAELPGVAQVAARVVVDVTLEVPGLDDPATGRLISLDEEGGATLNDVFIREGRRPEPLRRDEVLVSESFALANRLVPGDQVAAMINGRRRELEIVGIALSPEYVTPIRPGDLLPDDRRFGILWIGRRALATAYRMEGGFNDLALRLAPGARADEVIARLDPVLANYGGLGAIPRALQISHWYVANELKQLETMGMIIPLIFLGVAVFLLNVVLDRIVSVQREQIAALKALGYADRTVGVHYARLAVLIGLVGAAIGVGSGVWLGRQLLDLYNDFFRFPILEYHLPVDLVVTGVLVSVAGAALGAAAAVRRATSLPPAEAMRPAPPAVYRRTIVERLGFESWVPPPARMVLRSIERQPARFVLSCLGIAMAAAIVVAGVFMFDSMQRMMEQIFSLAQRQDVTLTLAEPRSAGALDEIARLPAVLTVEAFRAVPARLSHGHRSRQTAILGLPAEPELNRVVAPSGRPVPPPPGGLLMTLELARILGVEAGDEIVAEVLIGTRPVRRLRVARLAEEYLGTGVYMEIGELHSLLGEGPTVSGAFLKVARGDEAPLYERLRAVPAIAGIGLKEAAIDGFHRTVTDFMGIILFFNQLFGGVIAFGVIYSSARVILSERSRELGSLRVLGFTRAEITAILLGELGAITALAIPLGLLIGYGLAALMVHAFSSELFRIPLVVFPRTYALAATTVLAASVVSGLVVRRKLYRLDLIAVLKTQE